MVSSAILLIWLLGLAILGIIFIIMIIFTGFRENVMLFSLLVVFIICLMSSINLGNFVETETFYANEYDIEQMSKDYNAIIKYIKYDYADNKGDFLEIIYYLKKMNGYIISIHHKIQNMINIS